MSKHKCSGAACKSQNVLGEPLPHLCSNKGRRGQPKLDIHPRPASEKGNGREGLFIDCLVFQEEGQRNERKCYTLVYTILFWRECHLCLWHASEETNGLFLGGRDIYTIVQNGMDGMNHRRMEGWREKEMVCQQGWETINHMFEMRLTRRERDGWLREIESPQSNTHEKVLREKSCLKANAKEDACEAKNVRRNETGLSRTNPEDTRAGIPHVTPHYHLKLLGRNMSIHTRSLKGAGRRHATQEEGKEWLAERREAWIAQSMRGHWNVASACNEEEKKNAKMKIM